MVQRCKRRAAFFKRAQPIKAHGIETLEDVTILAVPRGTVMLLNKPLDFLKPGDDAFLAQGMPALVLRLGEVIEFGAQFVKVKVTHSGPRP
jgi:hypothetical protein